jgi:hypothetical protein
MDLARRVLLKIEAQQTAYVTLPLNIANHSAGEVAYHVVLLAEAGLVELKPSRRRSTDRTRQIVRLTWAGHEFLEAAREERRWRRGLEIMEAIGGVNVQVLNFVMQDLILEQVRQTLS